MMIPRDTPVTAEAASRASPLAWRGEISAGPGGIWTLDGAALAVSDADGPATVLVPAEGVRLLAVDLPIANRAKRIAALPYAIEDLIAEPIDAVHIALGVELAPRRYLVGVVRHDRMADWVARVAAGEMDHAALVPDCLALPRPAEGEWAVDLGDARAVVRSGDGTGFALPAAMLRTAWEAAGRPRTIAYGAALPEDMAGSADTLLPDPLGRRLLAPALDLRQGAYARRRRALPSYGRRLARIAAIGIAAHAGIALADTIALRRIADARADEARALVTSLSPGTNVEGEDFATTAADLLPRPGASGGANAFLPGATRLAAALAPIGPTLTVRSMALQGGTVTMDVEAADPALAGRIAQALRDAGIDGRVTTTAGGIRVTAPAG